jgi:hypothetical protein
MSAARKNIVEQPLFSEAAREYQAAQPRVCGQSSDNNRASDEMTQAMRRAFVAECLETIPLDIARAQAALECADDDYAFLHLARVVIAIKEAARTFNDLRKASKKGSAE